MEYFLLVIGIYFTIGFAFGAFAVFSLWAKGIYESSDEDKKTLVFLTFKSFFAVMFLWGTIPFKKK